MRREAMGCKQGRSADTRDVMIRLGGAAIIAGIVSGKPKLRKYLAGSRLAAVSRRHGSRFHPLHENRIHVMPGK